MTVTNEFESLESDCSFELTSLIAHPVVVLVNEQDARAVNMPIIYPALPLQLVE